MQQNKSSKKSIIAIVVIIVVSLLAYFYMKGNPVDTASSIETSSVSAPPGDSMEVLSLLNKVNAIKIDPNFFTSNVYKSLSDHTVIVPEQNVGKPNPFLATFGLTPTTPAKK
jgi:hypothetical protein